VQGPQLDDIGEALLLVQAGGEVVAVEAVIGSRDRAGPVPQRAARGGHAGRNWISPAAVRTKPLPPLERPRAATAWPRTPV